MRSPFGNEIAQIEYSQQINEIEVENEGDHGSTSIAATGYSLWGILGVVMVILAISTSRAQQRRRLGMYN